MGTRGRGNRLVGLGGVEVNRAESCFQSMKAILGERNETYPLKLQKTEAESMNVAPLCSTGEGPISLNQWFLFLKVWLCFNTVFCCLRGSGRS